MQKSFFILIVILLVFSSCKLKEESDITGPGGGVTESLKITAPNGGEVIIEGTSYEIKWSGTTSSLLNLYYSIDNGGKWAPIADSIQNTGVYVWFPVPSQISSQCKVRITNIEETAFDESDTTFSIIRSSNESLKIISPVGGEEWEAGTSKEIKWYSTGIDSVIIEYTTDNGNHWNYIATDKKIPVFFIGNQCRIRLLLWREFALKTPKTEVLTSKATMYSRFYQSLR
ncbi:hypothetical protein MROS_2004 [Melioribacter roseus P3M-2]|uniref:Uncharacterized protein n=1 Tax=Melioribacter roseus (strain DSM 23840 / JCM 17771 / VKM B-2668 / P3M-2) TaxID=1191523 RepID=I7A5Q9_MELRP|nr:hypothetical protein [Melioribacter roseus]AFN75236.1 hypothetical protein MROS_2004 [Melioribacter roseus P3M-2]